MTKILSKFGIYSLSFILLFGCTQKIEIQVFNTSFGSNLPDYEDAYNYYANIMGKTKISERRGFLVVYFSSNKDIVKIAKQKDLEHLAFEAHSCAQNPEEHSVPMINGPIFDFNLEELKSAKIYETPRWDYTYKIYISADGNDYHRLAGKDKSHFLNFTQDIKSNNLCFTIDGGNILGFTLKSEPIEVPQNESFDKLLTEISK